MERRDILHPQQSSNPSRISVFCIPLDISFRAKKQIKQAVSLVWFLRQRGAAEPTPKFVRLGLTTCSITYRPELEILVTLIDVAIDIFGTPKRVCSHFPFPSSQAWLRHVHRVWASRLAAPIRRHNDADRAVDPLIVAAASTTTFPFMLSTTAKPGNWEMGTNSFRSAKNI
jgi:hypothetical protein